MWVSVIQARTVSEVVIMVSFVFLIVFVVLIWSLQEWFYKGESLGFYLHHIKENINFHRLTCFQQDSILCYENTLVWVLDFCLVRDRRSTVLKMSRTWKHRFASCFFFFFFYALVWVLDFCLVRDRRSTVLKMSRTWKHRFASCFFFFLLFLFCFVFCFVFFRFFFFRSDQLTFNRSVYVNVWKFK